MIVVKLNGGLGNQMFQYAYAKALKSNGLDIKLDNSVYKHYRLHGGYQLSNFKISIELANKKDLGFFGQGRIYRMLQRFGYHNKRIIKEKSFRYDPDLLNIEDGTYIEGYFQSEKYFQHIRNDLLENFNLNRDVSNYTAKMVENIKGASVSCSIHVRRGDFTSEKNIKFHGVCGLEYYEKAINHMQYLFQNVKYFIFSDEIEWVKSNLVLQNAVYIDSLEKRLPHEDMYLMSLCDHNIIANSSFSWWGAWLNQHSNKMVIAPEQWFNDVSVDTGDLVPKEWIRL